MKIILAGILLIVCLFCKGQKTVETKQTARDVFIDYCFENSSFNNKGDINRNLQEHFCKIKYSLSEKEYKKIIDEIDLFINYLDSLILVLDPNTSEYALIETYLFNTLIIGFNTTRQSMNNDKRRDYQLSLNGMICSNEKLMINFINEFYLEQNRFDVKLQEVLSKFNFYLSYVEYDSCETNVSKVLLSQHLKKYNGHSLEELINLGNIKNNHYFIVGEDNPANMSVKLSGVRYVIFYKLKGALNFLKSEEYSRDTVTYFHYFHYFPLEEWRQPIFIVAEETNTIFPNSNKVLYKTNLVKVIKIALQK